LWIFWAWGLGFRKEQIVRDYGEDSVKEWVNAIDLFKRIVDEKKLRPYQILRRCATSTNDGMESG
jgi:hypothetical protein